MKPTHVAAAVEHCINTKQPVMVWGPPGAGKSSVMKQVADKLFSTPTPHKQIHRKPGEKKPVNDYFIDLRLPLLDSIDLRGLPMPNGNQTKWIPPSFLPTQGEGVLFLDELVQALPIVQAAASQLILDRRIGDYVLPDGWAVVAAGNRTEDRAATNKMPTHIANRFTHINFDVDANDWLAWAEANNIHPMVYAFIAMRPGLLFQFDAKTKVNATPRTWAFMSKLLEDCPDAVLADLVEGTVGEGVAVEFNGFIRTFREMPDYDTIKRRPAGTKIPDNAAARYAVSAMIAARVEIDDMKAVCTYVERMEKEFQILTMNELTKRNPRLAETATYIKWAAANAKDLINATAQ